MISEREKCVLITFPLRAKPQVFPVPDRHRTVEENASFRSIDMYQSVLLIIESNDRVKICLKLYPFNCRDKEVTAVVSFPETGKW